MRDTIFVQKTSKNEGNRKTLKTFAKEGEKRNVDECGILITQKKKIPESYLFGRRKNCLLSYMDMLLHS